MENLFMESAILNLSWENAVGIRQKAKPKCNTEKWRKFNYEIEWT